MFFGGAVFIPMARATKDTAFHTLVNSQVEGRKHVHVDQQVVGLSLLLPHSVNLGYKCVLSRASAPPPPPPRPLP